LITVEALLFAALGFLVAGLIALLSAPLYGKRVARLTAERIHGTIPITARELRADRGFLKARHALSVHDLEARLAQLQDAAAQARVEINRRDARISQLERDLRARNSELQTNENARRVLERTIIDRVPNVERHLRDARLALAARESEIEELKVQTGKTFRALDEAMQINEQQRDDLTRLKDQMAARDALTDQDLDGAGQRTAALEAELATLRTRARDQAAMIAALRAQLAGRGIRTDNVVDLQTHKASGVGSESGREAPDKLALESKLKAAEGRLEDRERALRAAEAHIAALKAQIDDADPAPERSRARRAKAASDRVKALEAQSAEQETAIRRLRAELAAANERLARQAAHYMDELRRLAPSARLPQPTGQTRLGPRRASSGRASLSERVADAVPEVGPALSPPGASSTPAGTPASAPARDDGAPGSVPVLEDDTQGVAERATAHGNVDRRIQFDPVREPVERQASASAQPEAAIEHKQHKEPEDDGAPSSQTDASSQTDDVRPQRKPKLLVQSGTDGRRSATSRSLIARISDLDDTS